MTLTIFNLQNELAQKHNAEAFILTENNLFNLFRGKVSQF